MGILVSLIIAYSAYRIAKEAVAPLLGEAPSRETLKRIEHLAKSHTGVLGVHDIIFHQYGRTNIVSFHIEVSDGRSAFDLHALAESVEESVAREFPGTAIAHVDPLNTKHPRYGEIERAVTEITAQDQRVHSYHDLRIVGCQAERCNVVFDIVLTQEASEQEIYDVARSIQEQFKKRFPEMRTIIKAEPRFAYSP
ncbi:MAG TPA: hypothetical protein HPP77_11165 [Candidatus Hydrogenedentes bacterium]|nr:hypothetical protein [Candidatus Hydrogenedentota bacterium]HIJ72948.1 hypothetical protein [Candidatus Hydrogenedentota bacterium]